MIRKHKAERKESFPGKEESGVGVGSRVCQTGKEVIV